MKKIIAIFALGSIILVSCSTSTKTTSASSSSETRNKDLPIKERTYKGEEAIKRADSPNLKNVSVADSKRAPMVTKQHTIQKVK